MFADATARKHAPSFIGLASKRAHIFVQRSWFEKTRNFVVADPSGPLG